jgi:YD repeat-containing protein
LSWGGRNCGDGAVQCTKLTCRDGTSDQRLDRQRQRGAKPVLHLRPARQPLSRSDANTNLSESFTYDALSRLTSTTVNLTPGPLVSAIGNVLSKSDVGNYSYAPPGSPLPHAVTCTSGGSISTTFTYDPNGNQTARLSRNIVYTSYNKPASIT